MSQCCHRVSPHVPAPSPCALVPSLCVPGTVSPCVPAPSPCVPVPSLRVPGTVCVPLSLRVTHRLSQCHPLVPSTVAVCSQHRISHRHMAVPAAPRGHRGWWPLGTEVTGPVSGRGRGSAGGTFGLNGLRGLFQPQRFCDPKKALLSAFPRNKSVWSRPKEPSQLCPAPPSVPPVPGHLSFPRPSNRIIPIPIPTPKQHETPQGQTFLGQDLHQVPTCSSDFTLSSSLETSSRTSSKGRARNSSDMETSTKCWWMKLLAAS